MQVTSETKELAKQLQSNKLLPQIISEMKSSTIQNWTMAQDTSKREAAWMFLQSIVGFENGLDSFISGIIKAEVQS